MKPHLATAAAVAAALLLALPGAARADVSIAVTCTTPAGAGSCSTGWYTTDVTVQFSLSGSSFTIVQGCGKYAVQSDTADFTAQCYVDTGGGNVVGKIVHVARDATPPTAGALTVERGPDANGWYNHPVAFSLTGSDALSGIASCAAGTYAGPDSGSATATGTCRDNAGNVSAPQTFALKYDATPPSVTGASTDRPADSADWFNHRVVVVFAGTDATSGIASCDSVPYEGPDNPSATVSGRCSDNAGNVGEPGSFALKFDSTPPKLTAVTARGLDRSVALTWKASGGVARVTIARAAGSHADTIYSGRSTGSHTDRKVRNGVRYAYTVSAVDEAGNSVAQKVVAEPSPPLIAPRQAARVRGGITLRWRPVARATYYNVQLRLGAVKVLTAWPTSTRFRVPATWSYGGVAHRLQAGRYVWAVWPGFGRPQQQRYGPLIGTSSFVVTR